MVQTIKCKCGSVFAACTEPECYTEKDWMDNLRDYVLDGCTVELVDRNDFKFEQCKCVMEEEVVDSVEFSDPNQTKLEL